MRVKFDYYKSMDPKDRVSGVGTIVYWYPRRCTKQIGYSHLDSDEPRAVVVDDNGKFHDCGISDIKHNNDA